MADCVLSWLLSSIMEGLWEIGCPPLYQKHQHRVKRSVVNWMPVCYTSLGLTSPGPAAQYDATAFQPMTSSPICGHTLNPDFPELLPWLQIYSRTQVSASSLSLALSSDWRCIDLLSPAASFNYCSSLSLPSQPSYANTRFNVGSLTAPAWPSAHPDGPEPFLPYPPAPCLLFFFFFIAPLLLSLL